MRRTPPSGFSIDNSLSHFGRDQVRDIVLALEDLLCWFFLFHRTPWYVFVLDFEFVKYFALLFFLFN